MRRPLIAVVNDDTDFLQLMEDLLSEEGYRTSIIKEGDSAYRAIKQQQPDLVVLDIRLSNPEGGFSIIDLLRLDPATSTMPIIVCSTNNVLMQANAARLHEKHCVVLMKPFEIAELYDKVTELVGRPN